jgi:flagellar biosynthesis/type III secretory pathway chaperone
MAEYKTYIFILMDILKKKVILLENLLQQVNEIEILIKEKQFPSEDMSQSLNVKEKLLKQLEDLDQGFETVYEHVKDELNKNSNIYKETIITLQNLIKSIMDLSVTLQSKEQKVNDLFRQNISSKKQDIKDYKKNRKTTTAYNSYPYKNNNESLFFDKKK